MINVGLFVNRSYIGRMSREVVPRIGETILIDNEEMARVVDITHLWEDPEYVRVDTLLFSE